MAVVVEATAANYSIVDRDGNYQNGSCGSRGNTGVSISTR